jgi:glycosyltransferase involved in cell wall biosynthesis
VSSAYWVSIAPWVNSGYGQQTAIQTPMIAREHNVRIGAISGLQGTPQPWQAEENIPAIEVWSMRDSLDFIEQYVQHEADFAITLFDLWAEGDEAPSMFKYIRQAPVKIAPWMPIDVEPLSKPDIFKLKELEGIVTPIAMSRHGMRMLRGAGFQPLYVPHSIDTKVFEPADQQECRRSLGLDTDDFIIGINAFNAIRKSWFEQLSAFALFHKQHPNSRLLIHSVEQRKSDDSINLLLLIDHLGLGDCIGFSDQFGYRHGLLTPRYLTRWYNAIDVLSVASMGEGFGIPYIEAQACGTPAIGTDTAAAPELVTSAGWIVGGQPYWSAYHNAELTIPNIEDLAATYEKAYLERKRTDTDRNVTKWQARQKTARTFAERYDKEVVYDKFWKPALAHLGTKHG